MNLPVDIYSRVMTALQYLSQGYTLSSACDLAQVAVGTLKRHVADTPELQELFIDAEQRGYDRMADALLDIDSDAVYGTTDPKKMKIVSDNIKWYLSRKRPQQYGERVTVEHNITADKAIVDALARGRQRAIEGKVLNDVVYTVVDSAVPKTITVCGLELDPELAQFV